MKITTLSPQDRRFVQGMTSPPLLLRVEQALVPNPASAVVRLDVTDAHSWDRVIDGQLGSIDNITTEVLDYGTVYDFDLRYDWSTGDLDLYGIYDFQFKVTFVTAEIQLFPQRPKMMVIDKRATVGAPIAPTTTVFQEVRVDQVNTFALGDIIYNDGSAWALADNTDLAKAGTNVVTQATSSYFYYAGPGCTLVFSADQSWTKGDPIYLEDAVLGKPSQALPSTPGNWINHMGYADSDRVWSFQLNEIRRA